MTGPDRVAVVRRRRRPTLAGTVLSEELIARTAMRLLDDPEGGDLSVRRLGIALGADPSSIYRYFHGMEDLLLAVTDRMIGDALAGYEADPDWLTALRDLGHQIFAHAQRHPRLAVLASSRVSLRPNEFRTVDTGIGLLLRAGFGPEQAVRYYHAFIDMVLGYAAMYAAEVPSDSLSTWTATYRALPASDYPAVARARDHIHLLAGEAFDTAVDLLLDALAARAPAAGQGSEVQAHERALGVERVVAERAALDETVPRVQPMRRGEELT